LHRQSSPSFPTTKNPRQDSAKSAFKKAKEKKLMNRLKSGESKITAYLIVNDNHEVLESYQLDDNSLKDSLDCLKAACDTLSGAHMGMRMELANGH
jgi:F0F1-type ATP synthase delta subunit